MENYNAYENTYRLLSRCLSDCEYFLGNGNFHEKHLWAGKVEDHIAKMRELWDLLPETEKPAWLSMEEISEYERRMILGRKIHEEYVKAHQFVFQKDVNIILQSFVEEYRKLYGIDLSREYWWIY